MNQLNKLIEHIFLEEILYRGSENAVWKSDQDKFVARLSSALASRPTCGKEQRLFLDEVEKRGEFEEIGDDIQQIIIYDEEANHDDMASVINNVSLEGIDLSKVIKGE